MGALYFSSVFQVFLRLSIFTTAFTYQFAQFRIFYKMILKPFELNMHLPFKCLESITRNKLKEYYYHNPKS